MIILPPLPPLSSVLRLVVGTLIAASGFACFAASAPWCNVLPLPLVLAGAGLAIPVLIKD